MYIDYTVICIAITGNKLYALCVRCWSVRRGELQDI